LQTFLLQSNRRHCNLAVALCPSRPPSCDPARQLSIPTSLFDIGNGFVSAGRQVAYLAGQKDLHNGTSMVQNTFWQFVHNNGPTGALYEGYVHVLDLVVSEAARFSALHDIALNINVVTEHRD